MRLNPASSFHREGPKCPYLSGKTSCPSKASKINCGEREGLRVIVLSVAPWSYLGEFSNLCLQCSLFITVPPPITCDDDYNLLVLSNHSAMTPPSSPTLINLLPFLLTSASWWLMLLISPCHPFRGQTGSQRMSADFYSPLSNKWEDENLREVVPS